jgi:protein TonB
MILPPEKPAPKTPEPPKEGHRNTNLPSRSTTRFVAPNPSPFENQMVTLIEIDSILHNPGLQSLIGTGAPWSEEPEDSVFMRRMDPRKPEPSRPDPKAFVPGVEREPQEVNLDDLKREIGYPALAKEGRIQGTVTLRVLMDETGAYREHLNVSRPGTHVLLVKAVEEHIASLRCLPGIQNGKAIPMWVNVSFSFKLL